MFDLLADGIRKIQEPKGIGDMTAALADRVGELLLGIIELFEQEPVGTRLFEGIEIRALDVLDQRDLKRFAVTSSRMRTGTS